MPQDKRVEEQVHWAEVQEEEEEEEVVVKGTEGTEGTEDGSGGAKPPTDRQEGDWCFWADVFRSSSGGWTGGGMTEMVDENEDENENVVSDMAREIQVTLR